MADFTTGLMAAAAVPHMKGRDRRNIIWRIQQTTKPRAPQPSVVVERYDPEAARKWFETHGVRVA